MKAALRAVRPWSVLRHWLRYSWISRLPMTDWYASLQSLLTPKRSSGRVVVRPVKPALAQLETRFMPNDPFGLIQTALLGPAFSLLTPSGVLFHGWGTGQAASAPTIAPVP